MGEQKTITDPGERLHNLCNALAESVAAESDKELAEDAAAQGRDIEADAERTRATLLATAERASYARRLAEIEADHEHDSRARVSNVRMHRQRGWLLAQHRAASGALTALGVPDDGTPLPQRIQFLSENHATSSDVTLRALAPIVAAQSTSWPIYSVLQKLADAVDHLLRGHGCDRHGYEEVEAARDAARRMLAETGVEDGRFTARFAVDDRCSLAARSIQAPRDPGLAEQEPVVLGVEDAEDDGGDASGEGAHAGSIAAAPESRKGNRQASPIAPEPPPVATGSVPIWPLVIADLEKTAVPYVIRGLLAADMRARDAFGRAKYGTPLTTDNGRSHLRDAYQEALDEIVYLRAEIERGDPTGAAAGLYPDAIQCAVVLRVAIRQDAREEDPLVHAALAAFPGPPPRIVVLDATPPRRPIAARMREHLNAEFGLETTVEDLARALAISATDMRAIEAGTKTTDAAGWTEIQTALFQLGSGTKAEHIADPASSPAFQRAMEREEDTGDGGEIPTRRLPLTMIVAIARNGVIGKDGGMPWPRLPEDMKHFKRATWGRTCIVGRKTYGTLPPLGGRRFVVLSRLPGPRTDRWQTTIEAAIADARHDDPVGEPVIIGGAEVYRAALPFVTRILLTEIDADHEGDTVFHLDRTGFVETERRAGATPGVTFVTLERTSVVTH